MDNSAAITVACIPVAAGRARQLAEQLADEVDGATAAAAFDDGAQWWVELQFGEPPDEAAVREAVGRSLGTDAASALCFRFIAEHDWVAASLAGLTPVAAGRFVVRGAHDRGHVAPNRIAIEIEAALAFGTGHHATTRGCLLALDCLHKREQKKRKLDPRLRGNERKKRLGARTLRPILLDIGTGTGVLAIAAAKAWRRPVLASDIDGAAVRIARENAGRNGEGARVRVIKADGAAASALQHAAPCPLIVANILLAPLKRLARPLARLVCPGGAVILSGILAEQADAALAAYRAQGLRLARRITLGGWVTLILARGRS